MYIYIYTCFYIHIFLYVCIYIYIYIHIFLILRKTMAQTMTVFFFHRPQITILWRLPGTTIYRNVKQDRPPEMVLLSFWASDFMREIMAIRKTAVLIHDIYYVSFCFCFFFFFFKWLFSFSFFFRTMPLRLCCG